MGKEEQIHISIWLRWGKLFCRTVKSNENYILNTLWYLHKNGQGGQWKRIDWAEINLILFKMLDGKKNERKKAYSRNIAGLIIFPYRKKQTNKHFHSPKTKMNGLDFKPEK